MQAKYTRKVFRLDSIFRNEKLSNVLRRNLERGIDDETPNRKPPEQHLT